MNNLATKNVLTIRETVRRAKSDGLYLSEYSLRRWVKASSFPTCQAGNKTLIYYPNLLAYLQGRDFGSAENSAE